MNLNNVTIGDAQLLRVSFAEYLKDENAACLHLIIGENSIGKTRLLETIKDHLEKDQQSGFVYIHEDSFDVEELTPLWMDICKNHPHVRGYILRMLSKTQPNFVDVENTLNVVTDDNELLVELSDSKDHVNIIRMGKGFKRTFEISVKSWAAQQAMILIDDIEIGLHYSVQKDIWDFFRKVSVARDIRFFATTHSMDMIDGFVEETANKSKLVDEDCRSLLLRLEPSENQFSDDELAAVIVCKKSVSSLKKVDIDVRSTPPRQAIEPSIY